MYKIPLLLHIEKKRELLFLLISKVFLIYFVLSLQTEHLSEPRGKKKFSQIVFFSSFSISSLCIGLFYFIFKNA